MGIGERAVVTRVEVARGSHSPVLSNNNETSNCSRAVAVALAFFRAHGGVAEGE